MSKSTSGSFSNKPPALFLPVYTRFSKIWNWLTEPNKAITDIGKRRQTQLLAGLLVATFTLLIIGLVASIGNQESSLNIADQSVLLVALILAYILSRSKWPGLGSTIFVLALVFSPLYGIWENPQDFSSSVYSFVPLGFVLASALLSIWGTLALVIMVSIGLAFMPALIPELTDIFGVVGIVFSLGIVLTVLTAYRNATERLRVNEIEKISYDLREVNLAMQETAERSRAVFESVTDAVIATDQHGMINEFNASALRILGVKNRQELAGQSIISFAVEADRPRLHEFMYAQRQADTNSSDTVDHLPQQEFTFKKIDAAAFDGEFSVAVLHDNQGIPTGFVNVLRDITLRKQAEQALRASEARQRQILDSLPVGILISRLPDGKVLYANTNLANIMGLSLEEAFQKHTAEAYYDAEERAQVLKILQNRGSISDYITRLKRFDDNRLVWASLSIQPFTFAGESALLSSFIDITERRQAESAVMDEKNFSATVINSLPGVFYVFDTQGRLIQWNKNYENVLGYSASELSQKNALDAIVEEDKERVAGAIQNAFVVGQATVEAQLQNRNGEKAMYLFTGSRFSIGDDLYLAGMGIDVTERRKLEEQIQQLLERRGFQVQTSTEVSQEIATAPALSELFRRVVTLVKERFGYYHTQILRYDPARDAVVLVYGYGEIGQKMLDQGHQMPLGSGLIGTAAATGETTLRPALSHDPDWRPNPLLPGTQGEIAVPIKLQDRILGVLDVQSDRSGALSEEDQQLLEGLCGQIAIAIESTTLRQEAEERIAELNALYRNMARQEWESYLQSAVTSYLYDQTSVEIVDQIQAPEIQLAIERKALIRPDNRRGLVATPLAIRGGEVIGALGIYDTPDHPMSQEEIDFMQQVSEQVALALESARLFNRTQQALSETEALYAIISKLNAAQDYTTILEAVAEYTILEQANQSLVMFTYDRLMGRGYIPEWVTPIAYRSSHDFSVATRYPLSAFEIETNTLFTNMPVVITNIETDSRLDRITRTLFKDVFHAESVVIVPLMLGDQSLGFILGSYSHVAEFPVAQIQRLSTVANQVAVAVQGLQLLRQTVARARREQILLGITAEINRAVDTDTIMRTAVEKLGQALQKKTYIYLGSETLGAESPQDQTQPDPPTSRIKKE